MLKAPRFLREYASYVKKNIIAEDLMKQHIKDEAIKFIEGSLRAYERGIITVDEAMHNINNCFCNR